MRILKKQLEDKKVSHTKSDNKMSINKNKNTFRGFCTLYESIVEMFLPIFTNINGGGYPYLIILPSFQPAFLPFFSKPNLFFPDIAGGISLYGSIPVCFFLDTKGDDTRR